MMGNEGVSTMIEKPNCGNCPYPKSNTPDAYKCSYLMASVDEWEGTHKKNLLPGKDRRYNFTKVVGCLSHPGARDYLMKDVIKELEERINMFSKEAASNGNYCLSYRAAGLAEAISLIHGVKE